MSPPLVVVAPLVDDALDPVPVVGTHGTAVVPSSGDPDVPDEVDELELAVSSKPPDGFVVGCGFCGVSAGQSGSALVSVVGESSPPHA